VSAGVGEHATAFGRHARGARGGRIGKALDRQGAWDDARANLEASKTASTTVLEIGPYRTLDTVGAGGMGIVYRARHAESDNVVALKTVRVPAGKWLESIRREIQALTRIRHPGVVRILDHGVDRGIPWYAMDILEGESLRRYGQRIWSPYWRPSAPPGPTEALSITEVLSSSGESATPPPEPPLVRRPRASERLQVAAGQLSAILRIFERLCLTLAYLHGEGFVNCDLKPENIFLVDGAPIVIDFGLTAHYPSSSSREAMETQRAMTGTLPYMSPEQVRGEFPDARSDLYSVGCMLYELLVGHAPFQGNPQAIARQHLKALPQPVSELVEGVPEKLEWLIHKLLQKDLTDRYGFADEVAAELRRLLGEYQNQSPRASARPYLYRARFCGREQELKAVLGRCGRAESGSGTLMAIGGESGVGKTRFAMEVTRRLPLGNKLRVVTSEVAPVSPARRGSGALEPLHAVRPLLRAVADRCQEGGVEITERLLGDRAAVLAEFEPLLGDVPSRGGMATPESLSPENARQRLLKYLRETLLALSIEQPLLWIIDDVGWADDLSLTFLNSLSAGFLSEAPLLVLCTHRTEEIGEALSTLLARAETITLSRLPDRDVGTMVSDMLAVRSGPDDFRALVVRESAGLPYLVSECLRSALLGGLLHRVAEAWEVRPRPNQGWQGDTALSFDGLTQRLAQLTPFAERLSRAGAVLGRALDPAILKGVADASDDAMASGTDELLRAHIFEQTPDGGVRFAHDRVRELAYAAMPEPERERLHLSAAKALRSVWESEGGARAPLAVIGHHFTIGGEPRDAARYLRLGADHARARFANQEAIRLYAQAIEQEELAQHVAAAGAGRDERLADMLEARADVQLLCGMRAEARAGYEQALSVAPGVDVVARARRYRKLGKTWEAEHRHDEALRLYERASQTISEADAGHELARDELVQTQIAKLWVYYWLDRVPDMRKIEEELEPLLDDGASALQRSKLFDAKMKRKLRHNRYAVDEETLSFALEARRAAKTANDPEQLAMTQFNLGFVLVFFGRHEDGKRELLEALSFAERIGDLVQQTRCLTYLSLAGRMQRTEQETSEYATRAAQVASWSGMREYYAAARANLGWAALRRGELLHARALCREALDTWASLSLVFAFEWLSLIPLMEISLGSGEIQEVLAFGKRLLAPGQHAIPVDAAEMLAKATQDPGPLAATSVHETIRAALARLSAAHYN
jgi:serine/threonine protein kinase/tetratricopeptide (TPR) repeat protein